MPRKLTLSKPLVGKNPFNRARSVIWYLLDERGEGFYISWVEYVTDTHGPECMAFKVRRKRDGYIHVDSWSEEAVSYAQDAALALEEVVKQLEEQFDVLVSVGDPATALCLWGWSPVTSEKPMPMLLACPFCGGNPLMWRWKSTMSIHCADCGANGPIMNSEEDAIAGWNDRTGNADLRRDLDRAKLMHRRTAEHLYGERRRRRAAEADLADAEELLRAWNGPETGYSIQRTPAHYRGDNLVTCRRAMESAASYWWRCAFKYVWRMWSKADPRADGEKAIDCIRKALAEIGERG